MDTIETPSFAAELAKETGKAIVISTASTVGMLIGMAVIAGVVQKREARKAKKTAQTPTE